jgi:hypothetical protein
MPTTANQGVRVPGSQDSPNLETIVGNAAADLERLGVQRFLSATDRTTRLPNPLAGMVSWLPDGLYLYASGQWQPMAGRVYTSQVTAPPFTTTGSYIDFTSAQWPAVSCVVPPSGMVTCVISGELANSNDAASLCRISPRFSGALTEAPSNLSALWVTGPGVVGASRERYLGGMSPGSVLTATPNWYISSGSSATASVANGRLMLRPEV